MKVQRSSKIYFSKWLTSKKKEQIALILDEYSRVVNYFISHYQAKVATQSKKELLYAIYIQDCIEATGTWLSARMIKNAFAEGYGMVQSYQSNLAKNIKHKPPVHTGKKAILSCTINTQYDLTHTKDFDFNITLGSIGNKLKISIPLKRHKQFNKWDILGERSSSIVLTRDYIQFSFEVKTEKKKTEGKDLGIDIGLNKLLATSDARFYGNRLRQLIEELQRKKKYSKAYYRKKEEIKEYIDWCCKQLDWASMRFLVVEHLRNVKHKMKVKRRLTKNIRRVISNWNYAYVLKRLQELTEINRVSFRSVAPFYTSQTCSVCGHRDKKNRLSQESFVCQSCGHSDNADTNAAKNILNLFFTGKYGSCYKPNICEISTS